MPEGPIYFAGDRLLNAQPYRLRIGFPAQPARHLRLTLTRGHPVFHWAISELRLVAAPEERWEGRAERSLQ